jgi:hypothetical protein
VTHECAEYIYYRRKKGIPWKSRGDEKYLEWSMQLQNGLIELGKTYGVDWSAIEFDKENEAFEKYGISMVKQKTAPIYNVNYIYSDVSGYTKILPKNWKPEKELNRMGLLPRRY